METILVIEDEEMLRSLMVDELKRKGYKVSVASDGSTGWRLIQDEKPDLILLDLLMPQVNGYEVLTRLSQSNNQTPCIVISNSGQMDDLNRAYALGADDVLIKADFVPSQLVDRVDDLLEKRKLAK